MSGNEFTLEQVTEMARRVGHWKDSANNDPYFLHYVGEIRPKWYSPEKLVLRVGRAVFGCADADSPPICSYSVTVTYSGEKVAEFDASEPFQIAYQKKQHKEAKMQKAVQDLRALVSSKPDQSSIVKPVTLEEVLGLINRVEECKYTYQTFGHVDYRFEGSVNIEGKNSPQRVIIYQGVNFAENCWIVRVLFNGERVFEERNYGDIDQIIGATKARCDEFKRESQERVKKEKLEKLKGALFKKTAGEEK